MSSPERVSLYHRIKAKPAETALVGLLTLGGAVGLYFNETEHNQSAHPIQALTAAVEPVETCDQLQVKVANSDQHLVTASSHPTGPDTNVNVIFSDSSPVQSLQVGEPVQHHYPLLPEHQVQNIQAVITTGQGTVAFCTKVVQF